jgi:hypothetical protein
MDQRLCRSAILLLTLVLLGACQAPESTEGTVEAPRVSVGGHLEGLSRMGR